MKKEDLINRYYETFSENDKYIAECIIRNERDCISLTIDEFAQKYHVSKSALSRFAQKLKLSGYSELKSVLRLECMEKGAAETPFKEVILANYHKIAENIRKTDYSRLFEKIYRAERILIFASGYSQARAASEWKRIFLPLHKKIYYMHGHDMAKSFEDLVSQNDLVIIISFYGESSHVVSLAQNLRLRNISMVSVTQMKTNSLAQICEENLYIQSIDTAKQYGIRYEITTPYFIVIELLFMKYQQYISVNYPVIE